MTTVLVVLFLVVVVLAVAVRHLSLTKGPFYAAQWRKTGREWAVMGEQARSEWCHEQADWFETPWWKFAPYPNRKEPEIGKP